MGLFMSHKTIRTFFCARLTVFPLLEPAIMNQPQSSKPMFSSFGSSFFFLQKPAFL